jgi:hypothetical protein
MAKKKIEKTTLTDWEWTLVWSSMRYFMGRQTIAAATWPSDFIKNYDKYLTQTQRDTVHKELNRYFEEYKRFGHPMIDSEHWERLMCYMDKNNRYLVESKRTEDGERIVEMNICFKYKDAYCPIEKYAEQPYHSWYINPEYISYVKEIISDEQLYKN